LYFLSNPTQLHSWPLPFYLVVLYFNILNDLFSSTCKLIPFSFASAKIESFSELTKYITSFFNYQPQYPDLQREKF